jgi:hypothetical protein
MLTDQKIFDIGITNGTQNIFLVGKFFEEFVLQKEYFPYQFDGWYQNKNYGKINNNGKAIFPKTAALSFTTNQESTNHKNLVFVSDAFNDFKKYHLSLKDTNKLTNNNSIYTNLTVRKSLNDATDQYIVFINRLYEVFYDTFLTVKYKSKLKNFSSFIPYFLKFIKIISEISPITRSQFIKSRVCDSNLSGLIIDFDTSLNYASYKIKSDKYISDPNFEVFLDSAKRFGFFVDRNAPWKIVADLESPVMKDYYKKYNMSNLDEVFNTCYHIAYYTDIPTLINTLISFWNLTASQEGFTSEKTESKNCSSLFVSVNSLNQITEEVFYRNYSEEWILRLYAYVRILESRINITQRNFEIIYSESIKINKYKSRDSAVDYINRKIDDFAAQNKKPKIVLTKPEDLVRLLSSQLTSEAVGDITF